jgi:hypothetical protein
VVLASCASARNEPRAEHPRNDSVVLELESKAPQSESFAMPGSTKGSTAAAARKLMNFLSEPQSRLTLLIQPNAEQGRVRFP